MFSFVRACGVLTAVLAMLVAVDDVPSAEDAVLAQDKVLVDDAAPAGDTESTGDTVPQISLRELAWIRHEDADRQLPVRVSCVVTAAEPDWNTLIVQDGESSSFVEIDGETILPATLTTGDRIEVVGSTRAGRTKPSIHADEILNRGPGELPSAVRLSKVADTEVENWNRFVVLDGTVYASHADDRHVYLSVSAPGLAMYVVVRYPGRPLAEDSWRGQAVRVRGALAVPESGTVASTILASRAQVEFLSAADGGQKKLQYLPLGALRVEQAGSGQPARVSRVIAQAISDSRATDLVLRDSSGALLINGARLPEIRVGDVVIATGPVTSKRGNGLRVLDGEVRRVGPGLPIEAVDVPIARAAEHPFEYVRVKAAFRGFAKHATRKIPVLREEDVIFNVSGMPERLAVFDDLADRSTVQLSGVCWPKVGDVYDFELIADCVDVLYEPPQPAGESRISSLVENAASGSGETGQGRRPGPGPGSIGPLIVTGVALLLMLVLLAAFLVVLRRTREQKKFYAAIHEQLNEVSHVARLNTLAEMVGALAHELNQPLASVTNFAKTAQLVSEQSDAPSPQLEKLLKRVSSESLRAGEIIRRLRSLVSRKTPGQVPTSLNQVVNDSLVMFRMQELVANGTVETHLDDDLPRIEVDPIQLQQVILNLLLNARDATAQLDGRLPKITVRTEQAGDWLTISVEDNGFGIASSDPSTIFEPYFTTKSEGMGLGLAISRTIVESHNGKLTAENLEPCGARLCVALPLAASSGLTVSPESEARPHAVS